MQSIKIKKKAPNIIIGLIFGLLAMYLMPSGWAYLFYILSALMFVFADQVINVFTMKAETGHFTIKGYDVNMEHRDKDGNIISKSK